jgi:uncharacterized repeat protein (TIGR02543 family)
MIKKIIALGVALVMLFSLAGLTACGGKKPTVYEDGYFQYIIMGENNRAAREDKLGYVIIVGFTESGKEQETICFLRTIDDRPVIQIGYRDEGFLYGNYSLHVYSEKLKKAYIPDNIKYIVYFESKDVDAMLCSIECKEVFILAAYSFPKRRYIYKSLFDVGNNSYNEFPANITFLNNYSDEINGGYYWLDNIEIGERIPQPPAPERDGYNFRGWFTESECTNLWDFNAIPETAENTEFKLYAGWQLK